MSIIDDIRDAISDAAPANVPRDDAGDTARARAAAAVVAKWLRGLAAHRRGSCSGCDALHDAADELCTPSDRGGA